MSKIDTMDKRYNHSETEKTSQALWEKNQVYAPENNPGRLYSIDTPPPTVSGKLHIGHLFSYTQTDFTARYKRMSGFSVFYPFGFDDNGLPTERYVEKKCKTSAHKLGRSAFIKLCLEQTQEVEKHFKKLWQHVGLSVDWKSCYSTISDRSRAISQESFIRLFKKGEVYRKNEPAIYCTKCRTSIAQAELDDVEQPSQFNDIVFKDSDGNDLIIGTTRPELLPSCVAMFYNPADTRYQHLKDKKAIVPIFGHEVPILQDDHVDIEKGTGLVMCCTFGDKTDIHWYKTFDLPYRQSIGLNGKFNESTGILAGLKTPDARKKILEVLNEKNLLVNQRNISHTVNVHERCKSAIEFVMIPQWFLQIIKYKKKFIDLADKIKWHPQYMKSRYINWVENLGWDWCLSRQRFYGIPFPVWYCQDCNEILLADIKDLPIDPQETPYPGKTCSQCKSENIVPDTDVMDTWNTSSLTPYLCFDLFQPDKEKSVFEAAKATNFLPMGMRPQAHDIIRTWAFYTIIKTSMHNDIIPWYSIVISGHVLSDNKEKISKSKGNANLSPERLLENYSADVIRYWTASGALGNDISFSETQLKIGQRLVTKIWNAFRFIHTNLDHYEPQKERPKNLGALNEWLLDQATLTFENYKKHFETHDFNLALDCIERFFWNDFCDTYLELIKDQFFNPTKYSKEAIEATNWTLYSVGLRIVQMYAPYLPYITEAVYGIVYKKNEKIPSIHQTKFDVIQIPYAFPESTEIAHTLVDAITQVRKLKTQHQLSLKTELDTLTLCAVKETDLNLLKPYEQLIKGASRAQNIEYRTAPLAQNVLEETNGTWQAQVSLEKTV